MANNTGNPLFTAFVALVREAITQIEEEDAAIIGRNPGPQAFDTNGACEYISVSPNTLAKLRKDKKVKFFKVGRAIRYSKASLDAYLKRAEKG